MAEKGNGDVTDLTLRLLRDLRAQVTRIEANMATKEDLAKVRSELKHEIAEVRKDLGQRIDVLVRVVKDNHRVAGKRIRAVEIRVGARRPR